MLDNNKVREHLFSLTTRGIKYDLDRMREAALRRRNPQDSIPCFHIAGTNGKGSICTYLESALRSYGKKTGLFTSPHLVDFKERFMVNGRPITEAAWLGVYHELQPVIDDLELTFFEATTLMAFEIFRREKVEWAVFETGLGGRLDATNIVVPKVSVISHIAMDHMEYLGTDLVSIAGEKLGIVKKHTPLVMAEPVESAVRELAQARCREMETACIFAGPKGATNSITDSDGTAFEWNGGKYRVNLRGGYQLGNAIVALQALKTAGFDDYRRIAGGLRTVALPGRFQVESLRGRTVVFDVGHNPDAAGAFCTGLKKRFSGKPVCLVTGIMKDKDAAGILGHYAGVADRIILTKPVTDRAAKPEELEKMLPEWFDGEYSLSSTVASAIEDAFDWTGDVICVAGSFFTVGEAMEYLGVKPYG